MTQRPPSDWALKYGTHNPGDLFSGYTPLALTFPGVNIPNLSPLNVPAVEAFQKQKLKGFTSSELAQLDCLPTRELRSSDLQNEIIPLFHRDNWEVTPFKPDMTRNHLYPLENGKGYWIAQNDVVWKIMYPTLVLASRILMSIHLLPWFDAFLLGDKLDIPHHRIRQEDQDDEDVNCDDLEAFWTRSETGNFDAAQISAERDRVLDVLQKVHGYRFGFMDSHVEHPVGPEEDADDARAHGLTFTNTNHFNYDTDVPDKKRRVYSYLDLHTPEMLLREDLNSAERMQLEWHIANIIVHEVMHAIGYLFTDLDDKPEKLDPYFEHEAVAELGYSYEHAMNLGQTEEMISSTYPDYVPPLGFWFRRNWPDLTDVRAGDATQPVLENPGLATSNDIFPIPLNFYQDMQHEAFWAHAVPQWGFKLLAYRLVKEGTHIEYRHSKCDPKASSIRSQDRSHFLPTPYQERDGKFRADVKDMQDAMDLSPAELQVLRVGRDFVISSNIEERFWIDSNDQKLQIENLNAALAEFQPLDATPNQKQTLAHAMLGFAIQAMDNHELLISGVMSQESLNGTTYPARRLILRDWNQGTRLFLRMLDAHLLVHMQSVENEILVLERARMVLWDPKNAAMQVGDDWEELQAIEQLRTLSMPGDNDQMRSLSETILSWPVVSVIGESYARLCLFVLDQELAVGFWERWKCVKLIEARLEFLGPAATGAWREVVNELKTGCSAALKYPWPVGVVAGGVGAGPEGQPAIQPTAGIAPHESMFQPGPVRDAVQRALTVADASLAGVFPGTRIVPQL